jgi:hypothetical protein
LLNGKPLRARLEFADDDHTVRTRSVADGRFSIYLPLADDEDVWKRVKIEADEPRLRTVLSDVSIERAEDGKRRVTIDVPERGVIGDIVDEFGRPIEHAVITIASHGDTDQLVTDGASFALTGLPSGTVSFSAFTEERETLQPYAVQFPEEMEHVENVHLVVAPAAKIRGVVRSVEGAVMAARLWAPPSTLQSVIVPVPSDVDGGFEFSLPPGMREVSFCVAAPGYAFRTLRLRVQSGATQQVFGRQGGGALRVESEVSADRHPYILHDGVILRADTFSYLAGARVGRGSDTHLEFEAPRVEAGAYALCAFTEQEAMAAESGMIAASRCTSTLVAEGAIGTLKR